MATTVKELREWLSNFQDDLLIAVDEGGLTLETEIGINRLGGTFEIGGWPLGEDDE